jgi:trimeric autotransporter adhesin
MKTQFKWMSLAIANAALISLAGCGGGGDAAPTASTATDTTPTVVVTTPTVVVTTPTVVITPPAPTTTAVVTSVIDGALKNATVCMDKNSNGMCDPGEVQGKTDVAGNVTLAVPNADVGKFPLLAMVGTDAVDADNGTVTVAYTMSAPATKAALISPLTHLVQEAVASTGVTVAEAESAVQSSTGITASLFQDFTKVPAPTDGSPSAKVVARMAVVTTQAQVSNLASTVGTPAIDNAPITQADINRAINQRLLQILPALVAALSDPANATLTTAAKEAAVLAALSGSLLTTASMPTLVAINNQQTSNVSAGTSTGTVTAAPPTAGFIQLSNLTYTNTTNWFTRLFTGSLAQNTPDASGNNRFADRKYRSNNGVIAQWNFGNDPQSQANLHWTGSAWEACGLNFESTSTARDAAGNNTSNYCNNYAINKTNRVTLEVGGKSIKQVYDQIRSAGYTNISIANSDIALGSATFPTGSQVFYQTQTPQTVPQAYSPGPNSYVYNFSPAISAGGDGRTQAAGVGCNSPEFSVNPSIRTATLEGMVAAFKGTPCSFAGPGSFVTNGVTYTSPDTANEAWGGTTLPIATLGNVGGAPTAFYTGNTRIRLAFAGTGSNPVTYYACKERFNNFSTRNCTVIGTGNYTITTLGDARVMTLSNPPAQAAPFTFTRTFVQRGGQVFYGYQDKLTVSTAARLNTTASNALLAQLGLPAVNPEVPLALTAASYQGIWDVRDPAGTGGTIARNIGANGTSTCSDLATGAAVTCTFSITNPATGAFSATLNGNTRDGTLNFMTGLGSGTYSLPAPGGSLVLVRR